MSALVNVIVSVSQTEKVIELKALSFDDALQLMESLHKTAGVTAKVQRDATLRLLGCASVDARLQPKNWSDAGIEGPAPYTYSFATHSKDTEQSFARLLVRARKISMIR